jgi:limonene-1,2-epoxide hydrolase
MGESENVTRVREFFARWETSFEELCNSFHDLLAPDGKWENVGFLATYGPEDTVERILMPARRKGLETIKVEVERIAESDGVVWNERVDHVHLPDGNLAASVRVVGVMEFTPEGKVSSWREYFDGRLGAALLPPPD